MIQKDIQIKLSGGLEARPIAVLVQVASQYESTVYLQIDNKKVNAKSIMGMMSLGLNSGEQVTVLVDGADEQDALANIDNYKNYTVTTTQIDIFFKSVSTTKIVDGYAYVSGTINDLETDEVVGNQNGSMKLTDAYYKSLLPIVNNYDKVEYDRENDVYRYTEDFQVSMDEDGSLMLTYTEFEWTLKDGKIWKTQSKAWYMDDTSGRVDLSLTQEYTNYGTTVAPEE